MNYLDIVSVAASVPFTILGIMFFHFIVFSVVGIFCKKTYPETDKKNRYGIIIPARNEETVVAGLIESIRKNNYPQDRIEIFVIAHNCTDRTAEVARGLGATVYEYDNPAENTMGYAFRYLFSQIERDFGTQTFDGFLLLNADNILDRNYLSRINDAFAYYGGECVVTSFRNSKNFGANLISGLYGVYFAVGCRYESRGRTVTGCSTRVQGTGYLINSRLVRDGWPYVTLAEDWEFTADQIIRSNKIRYCDDAVFYDEQPTSLRIMWRQRVRWSRGHLIVFYTRIRDLLRGLFAKKTKNRGSLYDIFANVLPSTLFFLLLQVIQLVLFLIAPLVDENLTLKEVLFGSGGNFLTSSGLLFTWLRSGAVSYVTLVLSAVMIFALERKRIKNVSLPLKILVSLFWPLFLGIQFIIDVQALFSTHLGWKPIPHSDCTSFDALHAGEAEENKLGVG
ncbi:MAG: glycosyltransferase family 2 protein [Clostridia bacterium]|nr:glycosyltransferase family 2 protein [Clostridia bacterium]